MNWRNKYIRVNKCLALQRIFVSRGTYIRAQNLEWFVANALSAISLSYTRRNKEPQLVAECM